MKLIRSVITVLCLFILAVAAFGQQAEPQVESQYILTGGLGFSSYSTKKFTGELGFSTHIATGTYSVTTLKMSSKLLAQTAATPENANLATVATGLEKEFYAKGRVKLSAIVDGGVATAGGNVSGLVSGGGKFAYDISRLLKTEGAFAWAALKVVQSPVIGGVQPSFSAGVGWRSQ